MGWNSLSVQIVTRCEPDYPGTAETWRHYTTAMNKTKITTKAGTFYHPITPVRRTMISDTGKSSFLLEEYVVPGRQARDLRRQV